MSKVFLEGVENDKELLSSRLPTYDEGSADNISNDVPGDLDENDGDKLHAEGKNAKW